VKEVAWVNANLKNPEDARQDSQSVDGQGNRGERKSLIPHLLDDPSARINDEEDLGDKNQLAAIAKTKNNRIKKKRNRQGTLT